MHENLGLSNTPQLLRNELFEHVLSIKNIYYTGLILLQSNHNAKCMSSIVRGVERCQWLYSVVIRHWSLQVDKRAWRVITSYLESHPNQETTNTSFSSQAPRSLPFDPMAHKSLNSELKCLYTAVTRAKCNLWMYDSNKEKRLPVFDYWYKRGVVKFVRVDQGMASLVFATVSSSEQWKSQGDHFKKRRLWEQALHCYSKADSRLQYLQKEVSAYQLVKEAELSHTAKSRYLDAALSFLEAYQLHPDVRYISNAALCLSKARPPKHITAAKLYEKIGKVISMYYDMYNYNVCTYVHVCLLMMH